MADQVSLSGSSALRPLSESILNASERLGMGLLFERHSSMRAISSRGARTTIRSVGTPALSRGGILMKAFGSGLVRAGIMHFLFTLSIFSTIYIIAITSLTMQIHRSKV